MKNRYFLLLISLISALQSLGQIKHVSGKVIDEDLEGFPGIGIYDEDTTLLITTNLDGTFNLTNSPTTLIFAAVGTEWEKVAVSESCTQLEVIMLLASTYHYNSHKKIDRLRKEQFDNRSEIHRKAFEQGVFKIKDPCFQYEFIPDKPELDKIHDWMKDKKSRINEEYKELTIGDTIFVAYGTSWRSDGTNRTSLHHYSGYTDETEFDCLIKGMVLSKDKRGNIKYRVISTNNCDFEAIILNDRSVDIDAVFECNFKYFRVIKGI